MNIQVEYEYKQSDIDIVKYEHTLKNYQLYAQRYFQLYSNDLRWVFIDYHTGTGKTKTALKMLNDKYKCIIIGNQVSQQAFKQEILTSNYNQNLYQFMTYQSFANIYENVLSEYFKNTVIIIDEFQSLYSQQGLNSYGVQLQQLYQQLQSQIKIICLSGTVLNTQWYEIFYIGNIFKGYDYWLENLDTKKGQFSEDNSKDCINFIKPHFITYHIIQDPESYPEIFYIDQDENCIKEKDLLKQSQFPLYLSFMSKDQEDDYTKKNQQQQTQNDILQQSNLLSKYYFNKKKQPFSNEILTDIEDIKDNSPLSVSFMKRIQKLFSKQSKIAMYNENINSQWGLLQWEQIIISLGLCKYGSPPENTTLCSICLQQLKQHKTKDHVYQPLTYTIFYAQLSVVERYEIIKVFNSEINYNGSICKVIMLSSIAETGLSLYCVTDYFILDNIPGFSQYQQIIARAIRMNSHAQLPDNQRLVNIYNLCSTNKEQDTYNYKQWQLMFQQGKQLYKILDQIRYSQQKIDDEVFNSKLFIDDNLNLIIQFLNQQKFNKYLEKDELKKIIFNQNLLQLDFKIKSINDNALDYIYQSVLNNIQQQEQVLKPIKNIQQIQGVAIIDLIKNNTQISINQIKMLLKDYENQFIIQIQKFLLKFNTIFSAWFIYEGFVYIKDDDKGDDYFLDNHKKLYEYIWDKTMYQIYKEQSEIVKKYNIQGIYFMNNAYIQNDIIQIENNYKDFDQLLFYISTNILNYQIQNKNYYIYFAKQQLDQNKDYQTMTIKDIQRYNILYLYQINKVLPIIFNKKQSL